MIARCSCGAVYWAERRFCSPRRCDVPVIVRTKLETLEEFEERILARATTSAQIRSLPQTRA